MKNRNKWITIIFLIFIFTVPTVTIAGGLIPAQESVSEAGREVLDNNGSTSEGKHGDVSADRKETLKEGPEERKQPLFTELQNSLNDFTQRLFLRTELIALNTGLTSALTGGSYMESTQVLVGKNNWLFYKTDMDGHPLWDYMGINHFTDDELATMAVNLVGMRDYFESRGIDFFVTSIPNKEIVYEENMPDTVVRVNTVSRADQVADYMWANTDLTYVYPKQALVEAKNEYQTYYMTDTHWNQIGAFVGLQEIFNTAYGNRAAIDSVRFNVSSDNFAGDLAVIGGVAERYKYDTAYVFDTESADQKQYHDEVIFVVGDSFSGFLSTVAKGYYREVHWIYTQDFTMDMIDEYHPDVIIWESVERFIEVFLKVNLLNQ